MSLRLWHRLFLAIALLSIAALALFASLQMRGFQKGFLGYVNRLEREKVEAASSHLADAYAAHGGWDFLQGDTARMLALLQLPTPTAARDGDALDPPPPPPSDSNADAMPPRERVRPGPPRDHDGRGPGRPPPPWGRPPRPPRPWPPAERGPDAERVDARGPAALAPAPTPAPEDLAERDPPPDDAPERRPPPPGRAPLGVNLRPRLLLLDAEDRPVAGNPQIPRNAPAIEIRHDGQRIGRLLLSPLPKLDSDLDLAFAQEQRQHMEVIALIVLLGALALAWALSRWLLRPVRALAAGTRSLAAGDYATHIDIDRGDELGALARDFNRLAAALAQHRDARRQWGADIAHELRTPISVLSGEIQALQDGVRQVDAARLASLQAECRRLHDLVEDLYQLSLSDAGALSYQFEAMDLAELVQDAVRAQSGVMQDAGLTLVASAIRAPCPLARGDRTRLRQLADNLLANATRYTDRPGRVTLSLDRDGQHAHLRIDDTAPGVPDAALPRLFERLYRVEGSRSRAFGGAGLGLAICRNIVDAHGGTIAASHSPDGGLRIDIALPTH